MFNNKCSENNYKDQKIVIWEERKTHEKIENVETKLRMKISISWLPEQFYKNDFKQKLQAQSKITTKQSFDVKYINTWIILGA